jgi:peptidoglycan/LPS O-acetylase OafA/YrhL
MRGFAALAVMAFHYRDYFSLPFPIVPNGETAVDLFFVLSGFVLAYAYERRFREGLGTARFMALRLARIYPMYLLGTALAVIADMTLWLGGYWSHPAPTLLKFEDYATSLLFIPWFCAHCGFFPFNFPAWSLLIELIANFFYRFFFEALSSRAMAVVAAAGFVGVALTGNGQNDLGYEGLAQDLFRVGFSFPVGVLLYRYWSTGSFRPQIPSLLPIAGMLGLFCLPDQYAFYLISLLSFPILIYLAASSEPTGVLAKTFSKLGAASFAVYMLHSPVLDIYKILEHKISMNSISSLWPFTFLMITVIGLAILADRKYDMRFQKILGQIIRGARHGAVASHSVR